MSSVSGVNYNRISGLASGLDTENMVKQMIEADSYKLNKYKEKEQIDLWKQDLYRGVNLDIGNFITSTKKYLELSDTTSSGTTFNQSIASATWIKQVTSSNTSVATVTATGTAALGSYNLTINKVAKGVYGASDTAVTKDDATTKISAGTTLNDIQGVDIGADISDLYINGKQIKKSDGSLLNGSSTVQEFVNAVNASGAGIAMSYDSTLGRFFISSSSTGQNAKFQVTGSTNLAAPVAAGADAQELIAALKLKVTYVDGLGAETSHVIAAGDLDDAADDTVAGTYKGQDAVYNFAGVDLTSSTNQANVNGISMTFVGAGATVVNVNTNIDKVVENIKKFFTQDYNGLIDKLSSKLDEKAYRDFKPLTEEQKKEMKEEDIKLWEEKAKSGLLKNDSSISGMISQLRASIYEEVEGVDSKYNTLYEIGITTKPYFKGGKAGQVQVDETKLRNALQENSQAVLDVLFQEATKSTTDYTDRTLSQSEVQTRRSNKGILGRIYNDMTIGIKNIIDKAGFGSESSVLDNVGVGGSVFTDFIVKGSLSALGKELNSLNTSIYNEERRLQSKEDAYYAKFTALEKVMSQMGSQSGWLSSQLG